MELREPQITDLERIRELIESTVTASYALSPQQIEALLEENFTEEQLTTAFNDSDTVTLVAESSVDGGEATVGGIVEAEHQGSEGQVRWLFVDPEHRGKEIGTQLFESIVEKLREQGAEHITATVLEANMEGDQFFERFDLEQTDEHAVETAGESLTEYVYSESAAETSSRADSTEEIDPDADLPETEMNDGVMTATTDEGQEVYINRDEIDSGTEGPFFTAYTSEEYTEQFGYYCGNCGSLDTVMDNMERVECSECGNTHAERSGEAYDDSYL